jgi:hypothetical protein
VRNVKVGTDTSSPYAVSFDTTTVADGAALVEARAVDGAERLSAPSGRAITIDNTSPTRSLVGPDGGIYKGGTTQTWAMTASDATSGIQSVLCKVDTGAFEACSGGTSSHAVVAPPDGSHTLTVRATS